MKDRLKYELKDREWLRLDEEKQRNLKGDKH